MAIKPKKNEKLNKPVMNERTEAAATRKRAADKAAKAAAKKPSAMGQSAKTHQKDLAKISGTVAAVKAGKKLPEAGRNERIAGRNAKVTIAAYDKAAKKTTKSFGKSK